jgi:hypothetical protein
MHNTAGLRPGMDEKEPEGELMPKTGILNARNCVWVHNNDEWDSFRGEGRLPINMAFGMSLLGYDMNIVHQGWDIKEPKKTWNNIVLSKFPVREHYDFMLVYGGFIDNAKVDKAVFLVYEPSHAAPAKILEERGTEVLYICTSRKEAHINSVKQLCKKEVHYLPPLFPIASINAGFVPCSYSPRFPELKVFMHHASWAQNLTISSGRFEAKEQLVIDHLRKKGYRLKLTVLVHTDDMVRQCTLNSDDITFLSSEKTSYRDMINLIQSADICVTCGAPIFPGNSMTDIISLGKPLIYISDGRVGHEWNAEYTNLLFDSRDVRENYLIYIQESNNESIIKLDIIMENPLMLSRKYAEIFRDYDFNNWKGIFMALGV